MKYFIKDFSVNVTKFAVFSDLVKFTEEIIDGKLYLLFGAKFSDHVQFCLIS